MEPSIKLELLNSVIEFLKYIKDHDEPKIPQPLPEPNMDKVLTDKWFVEFIDKCTDEKCYEYMLAASYLNIDSLLQLASAKVATMIFDMTIEQKRVFFNIENDFSPEEEKIVEAENAWAKEAF